MPETETPIIRIPLEPVESTNLSGIGYDAEKKILSVRFRSGAIYNYANVDLDTATDFYAAPSRGSYFARNIKGKYPGMKATGTCPRCGAQHGFLGDTCADCGCDTYQDTPKESER